MLVFGWFATSINFSLFIVSSTIVAYLFVDEGDDDKELSWCFGFRLFAVVTEVDGELFGLFLLSKGFKKKKKEVD